MLIILRVPVWRVRILIHGDPRIRWRAADYEATLADTYGSDYEDTLVVEGGETK